MSAGRSWGRRQSKCGLSELARRAPPSGQGRAHERPHARCTDLDMGKARNRGAEALRAEPARYSKAPPPRLQRGSVSGMCPAQIGCAVIVSWWDVKPRFPPPAPCGHSASGSSRTNRSVPGPAPTSPPRRTGRASGRLHAGMLARARTGRRSACILCPRCAPHRKTLRVGTNRCVASSCIYWSG